MKDLFPHEQNVTETDIRTGQLIILRILKTIDYVCKENGLTYWLTSGTLLGAVRHGAFIPWDCDADIAMPRKDFERFLLIANEILPTDLVLQTRENEPALGYYGCPCRVVDRYSSFVIKNRLKQRVEFQHKGLFLDIFPIDKYRMTIPGRQIDSLLKFIFKLSSLFYLSVGNLYIYDNDSKGLRGIIRKFIMHFKDPFFSEKWLKSYCLFLKRRINKNINLQHRFVYGFAFDLPWIRRYLPGEIYPLKKIEFEGSFFFVPNDCHEVLKRSYGDYLTLPPESERYDVDAMEIVTDYTGRPKK